MNTVLADVRDAERMWAWQFQSAGRERVNLGIGPRWRPGAAIFEAVVAVVAALSARLREQVGLARTA